MERFKLYYFLLINNISKSRKYTWTKESRTLKRKLEKRGNNDNKIKDFYWKRDMKINCIKAKFYDKTDSKKHQNL